MNDRQRAEDRDTPLEEVRVYPLGHGWWSWRYVERESGIELQSNDTFETHEAAVEAARMAYPDLDVSEDSEAEGGEMQEPPPLL